jgi:predicted site-specific integrase-resolvase
MKLIQYAERTGITYQTAYDWFKKGKIPGAWQMDTGTIIVPEGAIPGNRNADTQRVKTVVYARVSNNEQRKTNLETQAARMVDFCVANGWVVDKVVKEVGSGVNDDRKKLLAVLKDPAVKRLVVERKDRLTRFGFNYLSVMSEAMGFEIVVANKTLENDKDDLMADFTAIITSFCARLYSKRWGKRKADAIKSVLVSVDDVVVGCSYGEG